MASATQIQTIPTPIPAMVVAVATHKKKKKKKGGGGRGSGRNNATNRGNSFNGTQTDGPLKNITLSTGKTIPLSGQFKKFTNGAQTYANNNGMLYVANCFKNLVDKDKKFFEPEKVEVSHYVNYINVQQKYSEGNVLTDSNGNEVLSQVMVVTNAEAYGIVEFQKQKTRIKEDKRQKFVKDKEQLHGIILGQVDPSVM